MPLELFATIPPICALAKDAGSGPILRPYDASTALAAPPVMLGPNAIRAPSSEIRT